MKKLLLIWFFSGSLDSLSQCDPSTFVFSLAPGITQSGAFFSMEGGVWPIAGKLGAMAGPMMYDEKITGDKGTEKLAQVDLIARVIYKVTETGSDHPQLITMFGTARGLLGLSYRAYWSLGEYSLIGIEPMYVNRLGLGVNLIFTGRL